MPHGNITHNLSNSRFYVIWAIMKQRCLNKKMPTYIRYGGRGINVCDEWLKFDNFKTDMYESYLKHFEKFGGDTTIERVDNLKGYSKSNCKWATMYEQYRNRRQNRFITYDGKTQCLTDWARELGIKPVTLSTRITTYGWSIKKALITPIDVRFRKNMQ